MRKASVALAVVAAAAAVIHAAPAHADVYWISFAYSPSTGLNNYDRAWGKDLAEMHAMIDCEKVAPDCRIAASSPACVALAEDGHKWYGATGLTSAQARNAAINGLGTQPIDTRVHCVRDIDPGTQIHPGWES